MELYTVMDISFSMFALSKSFNVSLSWSSLVGPMATMKSKKASRPARDPGEFSCTRRTWYPSVPPPGTLTLWLPPIATKEAERYLATTGGTSWRPTRTSGVGVGGFDRTAETALQLQKHVNSSAPVDPIHLHAGRVAVDRSAPRD